MASPIQYQLNTPLAPAATNCDFYKVEITRIIQHAARCRDVSTEFHRLIDNLIDQETTTNRGQVLLYYGDLIKIADPKLRSCVSNVLRMRIVDHSVLTSDVNYTPFKTFQKLQECVADVIDDLLRQNTPVDELVHVFNLYTAILGRICVFPHLYSKQPVEQDLETLHRGLIEKIQGWQRLEWRNFTIATTLGGWISLLEQYYHTT